MARWQVRVLEWLLSSQRRRAGNVVITGVLGRIMAPDPASEAEEPDLLAGLGVLLDSLEVDAVQLLSVDEPRLLQDAHSLESSPWYD